MMADAEWRTLLAEPPPQRHLVQCYGADEEALLDNVARFAVEGLRRDEGVLLAATPEHAAAIERRIGITGAARRILFADATALTERIASSRDLGVLAGALEEGVRAVRDAGADGVRVFGEVVGLLWRIGETRGALEAEHFAEPLLDRHGATVFCAYPIDVFDDAFRMPEIDGLLCAHSDLLPSGVPRRLEAAVERAMRDVLGARADGLRFLIRAQVRPGWAAVPRAEATILWLRENVPNAAGEILGRARDYYRAA